jgi:menaquinone-dependent protoporphyrinogen oxidase
MTRVLVAHAGKHGSTAEIAQAVADELGDCGIDAECRGAGEVGSLEAYDAVVLGSAVYMKRWRPEARKLLRKHAKELSERPFWNFSSGPFGEHPDPAWSEPARVASRAEELGVRDHVVFGGRLPLEPSGFVEKAMVRDTPAAVADLRDWDQIRAWARTIAGELQAGDRAGPT